MSIRVLVVDDSAFARKVLRELLAGERDLEVVDVARDGGEALEKIALLAPDVVTLDLSMPGVDGLNVLRALPPGGPRVVVVSVSDGDTERGLDALALGAVEVVGKPNALATDRLYEIGADLVRAIRIAAGARPRELGAVERAAARPATSRGVGAIAIGASTGGPPAIARLLTGLPGDLPVPVFVVVHLPREYTDSFARRLDGLCALRVREAREGLRAGPGDVVIARGGVHLAIARVGDGATVELRHAAGGHAHQPAVDVLFESVARAYGVGALGVVLTGMGSDGLAGARAIVAAGGAVLTESEASCVVYGMPRSVAEAGLSDAVGSIEELAAMILNRL